ncbi:MAG: isoaspartyl peptidase/L-asparaginase [Bdellovibrionales bacterium]|nr:isoaspartyl peptidase/L-asparaginase [Bdellovibrionales bacterium]
MFILLSEVLICLFSVLLVNGCATNQQDSMEAVARDIASKNNCSGNRPFKIVVHGGAGDWSDFSNDQRHTYTLFLENLLISGKQQLSTGQSAVEVVESMISALENHSGFNAGRGGYKNSNGDVELDAAIMDGATLKSGAVAGTRRTKNPIQVARAIMERTKQVFFVGPGADLIGSQLGFRNVNQNYFETSKSDLELFKKNEKYGTVGAVVLDKCGSIASGTSTGGLESKPPGRVGDSPIIGAGTYANNLTLAVSMTGHGEMIIRHTLAHEFSSMVQYQRLTPAIAAEKLVKRMKNVGAEVGLIAVDVQGNHAVAFNTEGMIHGVIDSSSNPIVKFGYH